MLKRLIEKHFKVTREDELSYLERLEISLLRIRSEIIGINDFKTKLSVEDQEPYNRIIYSLKIAKEDLKERIKNGRK